MTTFTVSLLSNLAWIGTRSILRSLNNDVQETDYLDYESEFERFLLIMLGTILFSILLISFRREIGLNDDVVSTYFFARFRD